MAPSGRTWTRYLAWVAWGLTVASAAVAIAIRVVSRAPIPENRFQLGESGFLAFGVLTLAFATTALVIVTRRPRHPIGWILFVIGGGYGLSAATAAYTFDLMVTLPPQAPLTLWSAWATVVLSSVAGAALFLLIWLFPDGRNPIPSGWWPPLVAIGIIAQVAWSLGDTNWLIPALPAPVTLPPVLAAVTGVGGGPFMVAGAAAGALGTFAWVTVRARRSRGIERQQLKWFNSAAILATGSLALVGLAGWLIPGGAPLGELPLVVFLLSATSIPIAVAIAILRYRLYEIDRIISRTLVYGSLTAFLAATYAVAVLVLSALFAPLAGGDSLAVAAATLAVAGLFQPIRRRIQVLVDRRFYRAHYDGAQIVAGFAAALRDEVDIDQLSHVLRSVVHHTMQRASSSVWLRAANEPAGPTAML